jgi:hypothetical protein
MNAHCCNDTQYSCWSKSQSANGDEAQCSSFAFMCLLEDDLVGSQLNLGTPTCLPRDKLVNKSLLLYSSLLALQAQHASSEHDKNIISALKNIQDDKPKEKEVQPLPSLFNSGIPQPLEVGTVIEIEPEGSPPIQRTTRSKVANLASPPSSSQKFMSPRQMTVRDQRGFSRACSHQHSCCMIQERQQHGYSQDC